MNILNDLLEKLRKLDLILDHSYENNYDSTLSLIIETERYLINKYGMIAPWEEKELQAAKSFLKSNWLKASTQATATALIVSEYSDDEYWGGYTYINRGAKRTLRHC